MTHRLEWLKPFETSIWIIMHRARHEAHYEGIPYCDVETHMEFPLP